MRKLIAFDDDTLDKLTQLARPDGDVSGTGGRGFCRPAQEARHSRRSQGCSAKERGAAEEGRIEDTKDDIMTSDPDPFEQGQRAARENIPAEGNPYQDGSEQHALWAAGHEKVAGAIEANESEGS